MYMLCFFDDFWKLTIEKVYFLYDSMFSQFRRVFFAAVHFFFTVRSV